MRDKSRKEEEENKMTGKEGGGEREGVVAGLNGAWDMRY